MGVELLTGDCRQLLDAMPPASVQCCVTSPPYFGLRDYGVAGQISLEPTPVQYIAEMVAVFRKVRRVLRDDGTLWLNLGDSYASGDRKTHGCDKKLSARETKSRPQNGAKPKDLLMIPARVALALQEDGWWLRSDIIWNKPNPMPSSVTDRPTCAHEHVFLLTKRATYFYDADAIREPLAASSTVRLAQQTGSHRANGGQKTNGPMKAVARGTARTDKQSGHSRLHAGFNERWDSAREAGLPIHGANARDVWTIVTAPFADAHFATFPPALAERCIRAGTRPHDTVLDPFGGAGTTALAADRLQRNAILIELNPDYVRLARGRIDADRGPMAALMDGDNSCPSPAQKALL
jgi:DNA modification methylase